VLFERDFFQKRIRSDWLGTPVIDLEIAFGDVSAKVQPLKLFQPGQKCVETSTDVICLLGTPLQALINLFRRFPKISAPTFATL